MNAAAICRRIADRSDRIAELTYSASTSAAAIMRA
jgi:hypothetical protein